MDSFEFNKIAAAILIALLTVKAADLISEALIHPKMLHENVFKIEGVTTAQPAEGGVAEKKGPAPIEPLLAAASAEKGEQIFKKCTSCHTIDAGGPDRIGPNLHNIVGAQKAHHPGYTYSQAMEKKGGTWTYDDLNVYLYTPRDFVPGTKMSFAGIKDDKERADLIAYLRKETDNPPPLPEAKTTPETKPAPEAKPAPETKPTPEAKTTPETKPAPGAKTTPETKPTPEAKTAPGAKPTPETKPTPEAKTTPGAKPAPEAKPTPEAKPAPETKPAPEAKTAPGAKPTPETKPTPEAKTTPGAKPAPETKPAPEAKPTSEAKPEVPSPPPQESSQREKQHDK